MDIQTLEYMNDRVERAKAIKRKIDIVKSGIAAISEEYIKFTSMKICSSFVENGKEFWAPEQDLLVAISGMQYPKDEQRNEIFNTLKPAIRAALKSQLEKFEKEFAEL
jgi:hypothetical protein